MADEPSHDALLEAIEDANDALVEAIEWANVTASHGEIRPSTALAFDRMENAHHVLSEVDPTREEVDEA